MSDLTSGVLAFQGRSQEPDNPTRQQPAPLQSTAEVDRSDPRDGPDALSSTEQRWAYACKTSLHLHRE